MFSTLRNDGFSSGAGSPEGRAGAHTKDERTALGRSPKKRAASLVLSRLWCDKAHDRGRCCAYGINWSINPHMRLDNKVDLHTAAAQHRRFSQSLIAAGAEVTHLPFVHGAYDSVFAKDNALLVERDGHRHALLARPRFGERACEQTARAQALGSLGFEVHGPPPSYLEGGDIVMIPRGGGALLGYGKRSDRESARALARFVDAPVTPLELTDPSLFHLDMALVVLGNGVALVCAEVFTPASLRALMQVPGITCLIEVPRQEAMLFGLNLVEVGKTILLGGAAPYTESVLRRLGWQVVVTPLAQFHLAGGSAACLTARIHCSEPVPYSLRTTEQLGSQSRAALTQPVDVMNNQHN